MTSAIQPTDRLTTIGVTGARPRVESVDVVRGIIRRSRRELSRFLFTRGLWLIFLEIVVVRFALQFNVDYQLTVLTVLWALGWSMIFLSALVFLPTRVVTVARTYVITVAA